LKEDTIKFFKEKGAKIHNQERLLGANITISGNKLNSPWTYSGQEWCLIYEAKDLPYFLRKIIFQAKIFCRGGFHICSFIALQQEITNI